jgi:hypothetical protein
VRDRAREDRAREAARRRRLAEAFGAEAFGDPLPESTRDDRPEGWGEQGRAAERRSDDWLRDEVPPHHG